MSYCNNIRALHLSEDQWCKIDKIDEWSDEAIKVVMDGNDVDEILIRDEAGNRYLIYADELEFQNGWPKEKECVSLNNITGKVIAIDDELNEKSIITLSSSVLGGMIAAVFIYFGAPWSGVMLGSMEALIGTATGKHAFDTTDEGIESIEQLGNSWAWCKNINS